MVMIEEVGMNELKVMPSWFTRAIRFNTIYVWLTIKLYTFMKN